MTGKEQKEENPLRDDYLNTIFALESLVAGHLAQKLGVRLRHLLSMTIIDEDIVHQAIREAQEKHKPETFRGHYFGPGAVNRHEAGTIAAARKQLETQKKLLRKLNKVVGILRTEKTPEAFLRALARGYELVGARRSTPLIHYAGKQQATAQSSHNKAFASQQSRPARPTAQQRPVGARKKGGPGES